MADIIQGSEQQREFEDQQLLSLLASLDGLSEDEKKLLALEFEHYPWITTELTVIKSAGEDSAELAAGIERIKEKLQNILDGEFEKWA